MNLGKLIIFVKDMAKMTAFYRDVLGLTVIEEEPGWVVLGAGGVSLALHATSVPLTITDPPQRRGDTALKYVFHVDDFAAACDRLAEQGVRLAEPHTFGSRTFRDAVDPEGNVFQIATG